MTTKELLYLEDAGCRFKILRAADGAEASADFSELLRLALIRLLYLIKGKRNAKAHFTH